MPNQRKPLIDAKENPVVLTVFFGNTGHKVSTSPPKPTGANKETMKVAGTDLVFQNIAKDQYAIAFDGAYIRNKITGLTSGVGIDGQCRQVEKIVDELVKSGKKVIVNCYGESRGGVAALLTAKRLSRYKDTVSTNLVLIDPVPGNTLVGRFLDFFNLSFTNQALDLSTCDNLKNVLSIYNTGNDPFHTAILPKYHQNAETTEKVLVGNHNLYSRWIAAKNDLTLEPMFKEIETFLADHGTRFKHTTQFHKESRYKNISTKHHHLPLHSLDDKEIQLKNDRNDQCDIKSNKSTLETIIIPYFLTALKWLTLGAGIAALFYFTGGLAALPFIGTALASLGPQAMLLALPVTTLIGRVCSPMFNFIAHSISRVGYYLFQQDDPGIRNDALVTSKLGTQTSFFEKIQPYVHFALRSLIVGVSIAALIYFTGGLAAIPLVGAFAKGWSILAAGSVIGCAAGMMYAFAKGIFNMCTPSRTSSPPSSPVSSNTKEESSNAVISRHLPRVQDTRRFSDSQVDQEDKEQRNDTPSHSPSSTESLEIRRQSLSSTDAVEFDESQENNNSPKSFSKMG